MDGWLRYWQDFDCGNNFLFGGIKPFFTAILHFINGWLEHYRNNFLILHCVYCFIMNIKFLTKAMPCAKNWQWHSEYFCRQILMRIVRFLICLTSSHLRRADWCTIVRPDVMMNMNGNHSVRTRSVWTMILNRDTHTSSHNQSKLSSVMDEWKLHKTKI